MTSKTTRHLLFAVVTSIAVPVAEVFAQSGNDEAGLRRVDSVWAANYATHDTASAMALMAEDFFMTSTNGAIKTREVELADVRRTPGYTIKYFRTAQVRARPYGTAGVVTGVAEWAVEASGNSTQTRRRYTAVYAKGGPLGWRLVALHMGRAE